MKMCATLLIASCILLSSCSSSEEDRRYAEYRDGKLKIERLDAECQIVEGDGAGQKFYMNIIGDSFVRSIDYDLDYQPENVSIALKGKPQGRAEAMFSAVVIDDLLMQQPKHAKVWGNTPLQTRRLNLIDSFGVDSRKFCLNYSILGQKDGSYRGQCTYSYDPKDQVLQAVSPIQLSRATGKPPEDGLLDAVYYDDKLNDKVDLKAVCKPTELKLR